MFRDKKSLTRSVRSLRGLKLAASLVVASLALGGIAAAGAAMASSPSTQFTGCLKAGLLTQVKIGTSPRRSCATGAKQVTWNQTGPPGAPGRKGAKGATGASGPQGPGFSMQTSDVDLADTLTQVASLTLPAGSYVINADAWLQNTSPSESSSLGVCELVFGSATDEVEAGLLGPSSTPLNNQTLSMTVAATVTSSTMSTLSCEAAGKTGQTFATTASMTAAQLGSLNP